MNDRQNEELNTIVLESGKLGQKLLITAIGGSFLYGTGHDDSDVDVFGVFAHDPHIFWGLKEPKDEITVPGYDAKWFEVSKFFKTLAKGGSKSIELLFTQEESVLLRDGLWDQILENRENLLGKVHVYNAYKQHAGREARLGERDWLIAKETGDQELLAKSLKCWAHGYRLLWQSEELLRTNQMNPRLHKLAYNILRMIRNDVLTLEELRDGFIKYDEVLDRAHKESKMREHFNYELAQELTVNIRWEMERKRLV